MRQRAGRRSRCVSNGVSAVSLVCFEYETLCAPFRAGTEWTELHRLKYVVNFDGRSGSAVLLSTAATLTWCYHHFDPTWSAKQHHEPDGMIALCAEHHAKADAGGFTTQKIRERETHPVRTSAGEHSAGAGRR